MTNLVWSEINVGDVQLEEGYCYKYLGEEISFRRYNQAREVARIVGRTAFGKLSCVLKASFTYQYV